MHDPLQAIISGPSLIRERWLSPEMAVREVMTFKRHFGPKHLLLACHVALPWILSPELLNLIRINFLGKQNIPWVAEADFLLSSLCNPLSNDLFEVEPGIREVLLVELENETNWQRPLELAEFLQVYLTKKSHWKASPDVTRTQWWIARAYIDPDSVIEEMTDVLEKSLSSEEERTFNLPTQIQVATTLEITADPLERANSRKAYQYLINNSRVLAQILYGESLAVGQGDLGGKLVESEDRLLSPVILKWLTNVSEKPASLPEPLIEDKNPAERGLVFQLGGALQSDSTSYIEREADIEALQQLRRMSYLRITGPRQQGKSSLIIHLMRRLSISDIVFAYVDASVLDRSSTGKWYQSLCLRILSQIDNLISDDQRPVIPMDGIGWQSFLRNVAALISGAHRQAVIVLDEVGAVTFPDSDQFFMVLRSVYNMRSVEAELNQLTFILVGEFNAFNLIKDTYISPFNIGYDIRLADFTLEQVRQLVDRGWPAEQALSLAQNIHYWTNGQPYLTQLLCSYLWPDGTATTVNSQVERLLIEDKNHISPLLERLSRDEDLRKYIERIESGEQILFHPSLDQRQARLELLGVIKSDEKGYCQIRNRIYERAIKRLTRSIDAVEIFYSYAHEDERLRKALDKQLSLLKRDGLIIAWYDHKITAGKGWENEILTHLNSAQLILLLISPDFVSSDYCYSVEMQRAMERHESGEAHVIPIILRPADWKGTLFGKLKALPSDGKAITRWPNRDEAFLNVAKGIRRVVKELTSTSSVASTPSSPLWNVPYQRNPLFTGREDILDALHRQLPAGKPAALTQAQAISGLGGIGKTQTAVEYAYRHRDDYRYILWVNAATRDTIISSFLELATLLKLPERQEQDQNLMIAAVKHWFIAHDAWLLIFDNADDLSMVEDFIPAGGRGHLLLTTRAHAPSTLANRFAVEQMDLPEAMLLLLRRARVLPPTGALDQASPADRAAAEAIAHELDGLPLALDQAGAYIEETQRSLASYLNLYRTRQAALLRRRGGTSKQHPEPVATTWSLSFEKIEQANSAAAELLRFCTFLYPDAIPQEIITESAPDLGRNLRSVATNPEEFDAAIGELRKFSLVSRNPETSTLTINRLVQAVLRDAMSPDVQRQWAERAVRAVNRVFPNVEYENWPLCERYLSHAVVCAVLVEQWKMKFPEAARLLNQTGSYLQARAQYAEALQLFQQALAIGEQAFGPTHPDTAVTLNNLALLYREQGKYAEALPLFQKALAIDEQSLGSDSPEAATSLNNLALLYSNQGKYAEAESLFQRALAIKEKVLGPDHTSISQNLNNLASIYSNQGKYAEAEPLFQRALAIDEKSLGPEHPNVATSLNNLALLYHNQGRYAEAEPFFQRALAIREQVSGSMHPDTAVNLNNLASLYYDQGQYAKAEPLFQRALAIDEKSLGPEHPNVATSLNNLGKLYQAQGKYEEAEPLYQQALTIQRKVLGPEHPDVAQTLNNLGELYRHQGDYLYDRAANSRIASKYNQAQNYVRNQANDYTLARRKYIQAEPFYQQALTIQRKVLGPEHPDVAQTLANLASLYSNQSKYKEAEPLYQQALTIQRRVFGPEHPNISIVLRNYAILLRATKRKKEAETLEAQAKAILANPQSL